MGPSPPSHPSLPDTVAAPVVAASPAHYEVDPRGHRVEGRAARVPGADLVRLSSVLDVAALAGLVTHLVLTVEDLILLPFAVAPLVPLVVLYVSCASGMEETTLRIRRIVGALVPVLLVAAFAGRGQLDDLLEAALVVKLPLLTMPFGALAAHRALRLDVRARTQAAAARRAARGRSAPSRGGEATRPMITDAWTGEAAPEVRRARRWTAAGAVVLVCGVFLVVVGVLEGIFEVWWYGLLWMAAGVLCVALSRDVGATSSDRRLRRGDRRNQLAWLLPPLGALLGFVRLLWILSRIQ